LINQKILYLPGSINVFSSQLSLSYFCASREMLMTFLDWIYTFLALGGYFLGTVHDADEIIKLTSAKSSIASIELSPSTPTSSSPIAFGQGYNLTLGKHAHAHAHKAYLVYWSLFLECAEKIGLKLISTEMFENVYKRYPNSNMTREEMQISFINRSFVFQKNY
jgi:hypothetical protein